jgi:hypothetical protein
VYAAGQANWQNPFAAPYYIWHFGIYDFQRDDGTFYSAYTNASNYAVGVYAAGAGYSLSATVTIGQWVADLISSNAGTRTQSDWWTRGWNDATNGQAPFRTKTASDPARTMDRFQKSMKFVTWKLILVNALGFPFYIYFASWTWAPRGQEGLDGAGTAIFWGLMIFPCFAMCNIINILAIRVILINLFCYREWRQFVFWITIMTVRIFAFKYDVSRQYNGSQMPSIQTDTAPTK